MVNCIVILIALVILSVFVLEQILNKKGEATIAWLPEKKTKAVKVAQEGERLDFELEVPFKNYGTEDLAILDAYMRIYLPQEQYDDVLLRGKINRKTALREDDYFEAMLAVRGEESLLLRFEAYAKNGKSIVEAMENIPDVDVALFLECRGRGAVMPRKTYITLSAEEMRSLVK